MGGSTKRYDTTPANTQRLRGPLVDYLMGGGPGTGGSGQPTGPGTNFPNKATPSQQAFIDKTNAASGFGTQGNGTGSPFDRINTSDVAGTQSVDQLGGSDSAFFKNMIARYQPAFDQQRSMAVAAGKEGAGSLTGSGFANILGSNINRSIADQNATLSGIATHGMDQEIARQQNEYNQKSANSRQNAMNFMQLLMSQAGLGVGPDTIKTSGGFGALLPAIFKLGGQFLFNKYGGGKTDGGGNTDGGGDPYDINNPNDNIFAGTS